MFDGFRNTQENNDFSCVGVSSSAAIARVSEKQVSPFLAAAKEPEDSSSQFLNSIARFRGAMGLMTPPSGAPAEPNNSETLPPSLTPLPPAAAHEQHLTPAPTNTQNATTTNLATRSTSQKAALRKTSSDSRLSDHSSTNTTRSSTGSAGHDEDHDSSPRKSSANKRQLSTSKNNELRNQGTTTQFNVSAPEFMIHPQASEDIKSPGQTVSPNQLFTKSTASYASPLLPQQSRYASNSSGMIVRNGYGVFQLIPVPSHALLAPPQFGAQSLGTPPSFGMPTSIHHHYPLTPNMLPTAFHNASGFGALPRGGKSPAPPPPYGTPSQRGTPSHIAARPPMSGLPPMPLPSPYLHAHPPPFPIPGALDVGEPSDLSGNSLMPPAVPPAYKGLHGHGSMMAISPAPPANESVLM